MPTEFESIEFSEPATSTSDATGATSTEKPIDPATGEPTLAKVESNETKPAGEVETKTEPTKDPDAETALRVAAKTNRENRELKKQLETLNRELTELKSKPADNSHAEKLQLLDAIIKNPAILLKHGWEEDRLMKHLLDPNASPGPVTEEEIQKRIDAAIAKALEEKPEKKQEREQQQSAEYQQRYSNAVAHTTKKIDELRKDNYYVASDDAEGVVKRILSHIQSVNDKRAKELGDKWDPRVHAWIPTEEEGNGLINRAVAGLHSVRVKKYGAREVKQETQKTPSTLTELGFTEPRSKQQQSPRTESQQPTPSSNGTPLPTRRILSEIGFTK